MPPGSYRQARRRSDGKIPSGLFAEDFHDFVLRPDVERALRVLGAAVREKAVGRPRRRKPAIAMRHLPCHVFEGVPRDRFKIREPRDLPRLGIGHRELRLIVEHFFEMRHVPEFIHRVAVEPAAEVVADSAGGHFAERHAEPSCGRCGPCAR